MISYVHVPIVCRISHFKLTIRSKLMLNHIMIYFVVNISYTMLERET